VRGVFREIAGDFDDAQHVAGVRQGGNKRCRLRRTFRSPTTGSGGICAPSIRVGAKKPVKEESAVLSSEPTQTRNERQEVEAQNAVHDLLRELLGGLDDAILPDDAAEEDERKELHAIAASVFA
jgi:hypothetical protein